MPTLNINGNIRTNTAAGWAADATVYTAKTILVTTDATYGTTDQRKFKIADGTQTWSNLDYFPVSGYDDATSSIQTQLDNRVVIVKKTTSDQTIVTGVTSNEITYSFLISANTFAVGNIIDVVYRIIYTGTAGNKTTRTYINTSDTLTAATLLSIHTTGAAAQVFVEKERTIAIKSPTDSQTTNTTLSTIINLASSTAVASSVNIDWTVDQYFIVAIQLANSGDSGVLSFLTMTKF